MYVICKFRLDDKRAYTFEGGGHGFTIGDEAMAPGRNEAWQRVHVVGFTEEKPSFACKALLGKAEPKPVEGGE